MAVPGLHGLYRLPRPQPVLHRLTGGRSRPRDGRAASATHGCLSAGTNSEARGDVLAPTATGRSDSQTAAPGSLLVLGMHRTGTSAVAGALQAAGAFAGDPSDVLVRDHRHLVQTPSSQENPLGFIERPD